MGLNAKIWEDIVKVCRRLKHKGIWYHGEDLLQYLIGKYNLDAILYSLEQVEKNKPDNPMVYFRKILAIQSQNFNEREHITKHEELKRQGMPQHIKDVLREILE